MKHLHIGRRVFVRMGSGWLPGIVTANSGVDVQVLVGARTIHIHHSVIRRDVRVGR